MGPFRKKSHKKFVTFKSNVTIKNTMGQEYEQHICEENIKSGNPKLIDFCLSNLIKSKNLNVSMKELNCCSEIM